MDRDLEFIEMAKAAGVYGEDWHDEILEFAYMVAKAEQENGRTDRTREEGEGRALERQKLTPITLSI